MVMVCLPLAPALPIPGTDGRYAAPAPGLRGNGPGLWLRMQQDYDLWHAAIRMHEEIEKIPEAEARS